MSLWVKALAATPDNLSLIPGMHMGEEENQLQKLSSDFYVSITVCTHTNKLINKLINKQIIM